MTATMTTPRARAVEWARSVIASGALIADTETCGKKHSAPLVDLAIVNMHGAVLLHSLVNPGIPIPSKATELHGIGDDDVRDAPRWRDLWPQVDAILDGANVIAWNAGYDEAILAYRCKVAGLPRLACQWQDAMRAFGDFDGTLDTRWKPPKVKWWRLTEAAARVNAEIDGAHRALSDCLTCLAVVRAMSEAEE